MASRFILPTLALAGAVYAQCSGPSLTITTQADADGIANCVDYNGDITVDMSFSGNLQLDGVRTIQGDFTAINVTGLTGVSADQLATITGTWDFEECTTLSSLQFSSITQVDSIKWIALPQLQGLNFQRGVSEANHVYISNTQLIDLAGIELTRCGSIDVNNNQYLNTINVNDLTNITQALSFSANGQNLAVSFPNLEGAGNLTFRNVSSIEMPSLASVDNNIGFYSDYFTNISAPNLTTVGGALAFIDCPSLTTTGFNALTTIGGAFIFGNNSQLSTIEGFSSLKTIIGAIDFAGDFTTVTLNGLKDVRGGANVQTSGNNASICSQFKAAQSHSIIKGSTTCVTGATNPQNNGTSSSGGSSSANFASPHASFNPAAAMTGIFGLIAALLFL